MLDVPLVPALEQLAAVWRARADELRSDGNGWAAGFVERLAADVRAAIAAAPASDRPPLAADRLWTQQEAAYYLGVSARYLRESTCPKVLLPGAGKKGQPLVRYDPAVVKAWAERWKTGSNSGRVA